MGDNSYQASPEPSNPADQVFKIIESTDVKYTPGTGDYVIVSLVALFLLVFMPLLAAVDLYKDASASKILTICIFLAMCVAMVVFTLINRCSTIIVNAEGFTKVSPIGIGSWHLAPHEVASTDVELSRTGWVLILRSVHGKTRRFHLWGVLLEEIGCHFERICKYYA